MSKKNKVAPKIIFAFNLLILFFSILLVISIHYNYPSSLSSVDQNVLSWVQFINFIVLIISSWIFLIQSFLFAINKLFIVDDKLVKQKKEAALDKKALRK